jgi:integrase
LTIASPLSGLRRGELCGLRCFDVDLSAATVTVAHNDVRPTRRLAHSVDEAANEIVSG